MCKDMDSAIEEWQLAVDFPTLNGAEILPKWDVPQPITVIRTSWKNLPLAKSMADAKFVAWATDLDWSGEWTLVMQGIRLSRLVLAVQGRSVWLGKYSPEQPGEFLLKTFHQTVLMEVMKANI
ncbi:MAG: hypothetical protein IPN29_02370 [Saprospiraceae bacterium]|nr:hypothetical protein [Saprospiraceae bacterium]